jgi:hypothetical protein
MLRSLFAASLALPLLFSCASSPASGGTSGSGGSGGGPVDAGVDAPSAHDAGPDAPLDAEPGAPGDAEAGTCKLAQPFSSKNAVCNDCAEAQCCPEINGCLLDPACNDDYVNCSLVCAFTDFDAGADGGSDAGTAGCLADCAAQYPKGKAEYDAAFGCADTACATECQ